MIYHCREYGQNEYIETDIENFDTLYEECLRRYGRFVIYEQREFHIDGEFICYYPHPVFVKNEVDQIKLDMDINKMPKVIQLNIQNIKDIKI